MSAPTQTRLTDAVAEEVRVLLARKRLRQSQFAALLGTSEVWVSRRLSGKTEISLDDLQLIARALEVKASQLIPNGSSAIVAEQPPAPHPVRGASPRGVRSATRRPARTGRPLHSAIGRSPVVA